jgi:serine/threonine protein phosphatase PrpC
MTTSVEAAMARRPGTEPPCADGAHIQRHDGHVYAAVTDGAGHHPDTVQYAQLASAAITHLAAAVGGLAAMITAGQMAHAYDTIPHVSAVSARMAPDRGTWLHWIGDCRAYGWVGEQLSRHTTDQSMGQFLRFNGQAEEMADRHDNWSRMGLWQAAAATVMETSIPPEIDLVLLTSDGIHDQIPHDEMERLVAEHADDAQALADVLAAAAAEDDDGYRDDATVIVLLRRHTPKES